jgi:putative transcriptional regulator
VLTDFSEINFPLFFGGPVNTNCLYFIHRVGNKIPKSVHITDGIFWGGDIEIAKQLINDARITNNQIRFFIGYSGWNPNQLTQELKEKSWVVTNFSANQWDETPKMLWSNILRTLGGEYTLWANSPSDPAMN